MKTRLIPALAAALLLAAGAAHAQKAPTPEMEQDIARLMEMTGSGDLATQMMAQMIGPMQQALPEVPDEYWKRFMEKADGNELTAMIVPIYAKHFTHAEIKELVAFYETPLGQKVIATLPAIMQESMVVGQKWGEQVGQEIYDELKAEGYI